MQSDVVTSFHRGHDALLASLLPLAGGERVEVGTYVLVSHNRVLLTQHQVGNPLQSFTGTTGRRQER